jgi:hypothetical protein
MRAFHGFFGVWKLKNGKCWRGRCVLNVADAEAAMDAAGAAVIGMMTDGEGADIPASAAIEAKRCEIRGFIGKV